MAAEIYVPETEESESTRRPLTMPLVTPDLATPRDHHRFFVRSIDDCHVSNVWAPLARDRFWSGSLLLSGVETLRPSKTPELDMLIIQSLVIGNTWTEKAQGKLEHLRSLESDWDSYGSEPPSREALATAGELLGMLIEEDLEPTRVVPSVEGGVVFDFIYAKRYAAIEILNTGEVTEVYMDESRNASASPLSDEHDELLQAIQKIQSFLKI